MTSSERLANVRQRLLQWIADTDSAGASDAAAATITGESILIRDDFYVGRRFRTARYRAVWFMEEDQLKIYDADGVWLATLSGTELVGSAAPTVAVPMVRSAEAQDAGSRSSESQTGELQNDSALGRAA